MDKTQKDDLVKLLEDNYQNINICAIIYEDADNVHWATNLKDDNTLKNYLYFILDNYLNKTNIIPFLKKDN